MALGQAVLRITANVKGLVGGLKTAQTKLKTFGASVNKLGSNLTSAGMKATMFGAAILAAFAPAVIQGAKFEQTMANARSVIGDVQSEAADARDRFSQLTAKAQELGETTEWSASQVAEAMQFMGMAGMMRGDHDEVPY